MSTPQCHEINVMTFDAECHEICFVGRKTNVMTLMSWDLENVMRFIFSGTGPRAVLAPCRPLPLRGKWSVRTQGGLGWWGVCAVPWMDLIVSISQHYVFIYKCEFIYPHHWDTLMPATVLLSHAGTGPHYLGGKWSVRTPGVGGRTGGDLRHGTGHQPAPHHPLTHLNTAFQS